MEITLALPCYRVMLATKSRDTKSRALGSSIFVSEENHDTYYCCKDSLEGSAGRILERVHDGQVK
jgi:hypothetical protein